MRKKVVIIGGGVAGLTAAHELIERGFDVSVYEQRDRLGGKAASSSNDGLPGEHGFRFFPGWYQHVPDTMKRIPYGSDQGSRKRTVYHNLVCAETNLFASYQRESIPALTRFPRNWKDLKTIVAFPQRILELGIPYKDVTFFFGKLLQFALKPDADREKEYDQLTWWTFMEADQRSVPFREYLVDGLTRNTVAADPKQASAYTIGHAALRTLFDVLRPEGIDRVLNGPTSAAWIDPWVEHLKARGVEFHLGAELVSVEVDGSRLGHVSVRVGDVERRQSAAKLDLLRLLNRLLHEASRGEKANGRHNAWVERTTDYQARVASLFADLPERRLAQWACEFRDGLGRKVESTLRTKLKDPPPANVPALRDVQQWLDGLYKAAWEEYEQALRVASTKDVEADYFVFALPVEQMAFYVHRSEMLKRLDPDLVKLIPLSDEVGWMSGIQFYLTENQRITPGHIDCIDSEWRLTAISQLQFWSDTHLSALRNAADGLKVKAVLSVDISAWDIKGKLFKKAAYACNREEIAQEVWYQLKRSLNRPNQLPILYDGMLLGSDKSDGDRVSDPMSKPEVPSESYHLDDDVVNRFDRKKQEFYKKFESVRFSAEVVGARQDTSPDDDHLATSFAYGDRIELNAEPLLINRVNSLALRPGVSTKIPNMFLAADYVRTTTNLATMEAANEAARLAVNEILKQSDSQETPCRTWQWQPSDVLREIQALAAYPEATMALEYAASPFRFAAEAASKVTELATKALARVTERSK